MFKEFKFEVILIAIILIGILIFQVTSGLFESQSPESKILEILENN